jgi:hypothetical protein
MGHRIDHAGGKLKRGFGRRAPKIIGPLQSRQNVVVRHLRRIEQDQHISRGGIGGYVSNSGQ